VRECIPEILSTARLPLTFSWLAGMFHHVGDTETEILLLRRYLELAPDAPDKENVLQGIRAGEWMIAVARKSQHETAANRNDRGVAPIWLWIRTRIRLRTRIRQWRR